MLDQIAAWVTKRLEIPGLPLWVSVVGLAILMAAGSIAVTALALVKIPADYFLGPHTPDWTRHRHPILRWSFRIFRNFAGWLLVSLGIVLSLPGVPGQGLLTILLGLMLVEFPGKRQMEQRLVRWPRVRKSVDAIRRRFGAAPLILENDELDRAS
ncbi:MAG: hypothetical protein ACJ8C4_12870 [Gemmataceae bacterium]